MSFLGTKNGWRTPHFDFYGGHQNCQGQCIPAIFPCQGQCHPFETSDNKTLELRGPIICTDYQFNSVRLWRSNSYWTRWILARPENEVCIPDYLPCNMTCSDPGKPIQRVVDNDRIEVRTYYFIIYIILCYYRYILNGHHQCVDECWPDEWVCEGEGLCILKDMPCRDGLCPEGYILCANDSSRNYEPTCKKDGYCNGHCLDPDRPILFPLRQSCEPDCPGIPRINVNIQSTKLSLYVSVHGYLYKDLHRMCQGQCIPTIVPCDGKCPSIKEGFNQTAVQLKGPAKCPLLLLGIGISEENTFFSGEPRPAIARQLLLDLYCQEICALPSTICGKWPC